MSNKKIDSYEKYLKKLRKRNFRRPKYDLDRQINTTINKFKEGQVFQESLVYTKKELIENSLERFGIKNYVVNDDLSVDVDGDVNFYSNRNSKMYEIPFNFKNVSGNFIIMFCELKSLKGSPKYVGGRFKANDNKLSSLIGAPEEVGGDFDVRFNDLTSLEGMPLEIGGDCDLSRNYIKELNSMSYINGTLTIDDSVDLSKFEGYYSKIELRETLVDKNKFISNPNLYL